MSNIIDRPSSRHELYVTIHDTVHSVEVLLLQKLLPSCHLTQLQALGLTRRNVGRSVQTVHEGDEILPAYGYFLLALTKTDRHILHQQFRLQILMISYKSEKIDLDLKASMNGCISSFQDMLNGCS